MDLTTVLICAGVALFLVLLYVFLRPKSKKKDKPVKRIRVVGNRKHTGTWRIEITDDQQIKELIEQISVLDHPKVSIRLGSDIYHLKKASKEVF